MLRNDCRSIAWCLRSLRLRVSCKNFVAGQSYGGVVPIADDIELIAEPVGEPSLVSCVHALPSVDSSVKTVAG